MDDYLDLPRVIEPSEPEVITYDYASKPYRFIRLYQTSYDPNIGQNKEQQRDED